MSSTPNKSLLLGAAGFLAVFSLLFAYRYSLFRAAEPSATVYRLPEGASTLSIYVESWKRIRQGDQAVGYAHRRVAGEADGYRLWDTIRMRLNTQGYVQDVAVESQTRLNEDYSLQSVAIRLQSGVFFFKATAEVRSEALTVVTRTGGDERRLSIPLPTPPYVSAGVLMAMGGRRTQAGERFVFPLFDPVTLALSPLEVEVGADVDLAVDGRQMDAKRLVMRLKGAEQTVWLSHKGEILKESGLFGIVMEKTTREQALLALSSDPQGDLAGQAAVRTNRAILDPGTLDRLQVRLTGVAAGLETLASGRQTVRDDVVSIEKEGLSDLPAAMALLAMPTELQPFLAAEALIQSDHREIQALVARLFADIEPPLERLRAVVEWVFRHVQKRPVLAVPDAVSTFRHRVGDCNEHAVLTAALARAAGLPAKVETGLVYQNGRFYYHAWNSVFVGRWITADAVFNQVPADVTHIRLAEGVDGLDLLKFTSVQEITIIEATIADEDQGGRP